MEQVGMRTLGKRQAAGCQSPVKLRTAHTYRRQPSPLTRGDEWSPRARLRWSSC